MPSSAVPATVLSERPVPNGRRVTLALHVAGARVPAALLLPTVAASVPAALLLHGYSASKDLMLESAGRALLRHGVASLAIDLPMHGERDEPVDDSLFRNPLGLMRHWQSALEECRLALRYLEERPEIDGARLSLIGYSLGAYLGAIVAAREPAVRALVLAAGGDLPAGIPFAAMIRAVVDPLRAVRKLAGRPLLMVNGRTDRTIRPDQAERLYAAANEPKEIRWYDGGHYIPPAAIDGAMAWLAERLSAGESRAPSAERRA
jgi:predicted esterase